MNIIVKVFMASGEIYNFHFVNISSACSFTSSIEQFLEMRKDLLCDSIDNIKFIVSDGFVEMSVIW